MSTLEELEPVMSENAQVKTLSNVPMCFSENIFPRLSSNLFMYVLYSISDDTDFLSHFGKYLFNQKEWLSVFDEYKGIVNFNGIILAGWQRYDHFSVLSELFPVAIPSLAMSLRLLSGKIKS